MSSSQNTCWIGGGEIGSESCLLLEFTFTVVFIVEGMSKTGRASSSHGPMMANSWTLFESFRNMLSAMPSRSPHKSLANYQSQTGEIGRMTLLFRLHTPRCSSLRGLHPNVRSSGTPHHRLHQWHNAIHIFANPLWSSALRDAIARHARSLVMWIKQCEPQAGHWNGMQAVFRLGQVLGTFCCRFGGQFVARIELSIIATIWQKR